MNLLSFTRNSIVVFSLGFLPVPILLNLGYDSLLVSSFSIAIMLVWSDGLLTMFSLQKGATEINPLIKLLNKISGEKKGVLVSRVIGSVLPLIGLLERNLYFIVVIVWLFTAAICLNSLTLVSVLGEKVNSD